MSIRHSEFLTTREVAELLLVSTATVRLWAKKGLLPVHSHTPGGHRRFLRADVEGLRKANTEVGGGAVAWLEPDPGAAAAANRHGERSEGG
ncbi:MAG: helix-turn-helix domain-containing protein [gamma proteobacterium symbiont of Phacoides pectinatus]